MCLGVVIKQKPMVTSLSSMLSFRVTCLDEPSGEGDLHAVHVWEESADKYSTRETCHSALTQLRAKFRECSAP